MIVKLNAQDFQTSDPYNLQKAFDIIYSCQRRGKLLIESRGWELLSYEIKEEAIAKFNQVKQTKLTHKQWEDDFFIKTGKRCPYHSSDRHNGITDYTGYIQHLKDIGDDESLKFMSMRI